MDVPLRIYIFMRGVAGEVGRKLDGSWTEIDFSMFTRCSAVRGFFSEACFVAIVIRVLLNVSRGVRCVR